MNKWMKELEKRLTEQGFQANTCDSTKMVEKICVFNCQLFQETTPVLCWSSKAVCYLLQKGEHHLDKVLIVT